MSRKSFFCYALVFIVGFFLGSIALSLCENYLSFKFEPVFSLGDVLSATTAIVVAVLVARYLEKQTSQDETQKQILLHLLSDTHQIVLEFEKANDSGKLIQIIAELTRLKKANVAFTKLLEGLDYSAELKARCNCEELIKDIRKLATETPVRQIKNHAERSRCTTQVKEGIISLADEKRNLLDQKVDEIKLKIIQCKISINNA